jgi:hypothetical protein
MIREGSPSAPTIADMAAAAFILSRDARDSHGLLDQGRPAFDAAVFAWGETVSMGQVRAMVDEMGRMIRDAFFTLAPDPEPGADGQSAS